MSTLKIRGYYHIVGSNKGKRSLSDAVLKRIAARCPNLQVLHLEDYDTKKISFDSLPKSIVCLEMVECTLKSRLMTHKLKHLPKLEHLKLDICDWFSDSVMIDISAWRNLKHLFIGGSGFQPTNSGVITIANNLCELEYLYICFTIIDDYAVYHITQNLKKLKELCLVHCRMVTDNSVVKIATGLPLLNKLDMSHSCLVTMKGLKTLFGRNIRELIVVGLTDLSQKEKQALRRRFAVTRFR
ncbi:hypothetical protein BsWGS_20205 [Bradybaena similaris]